MKILQEIKGFAEEVGADADHLWEAFKAFVRNGISAREAVEQPKNEAPAKEEAAPATSEPEAPTEPAAAPAAEAPAEAPAEPEQPAA